MHLADMATANAISLEIKKDGLTQRQSGDWQLRVTVAAVDMDVRLTNAPMGTRYACVLVEINDDETPVDHAAVERDRWRDLGPTTQAGIRCNDAVFWAYLREGQHQMLGVTDAESAAQAVRNICGISSRSDLAKPGFSDARQAWYRLDNGFTAWKMREHAG